MSRATGSIRPASAASTLSAKSPTVRVVEVASAACWRRSARPVGDGPHLQRVARHRPEEQPDRDSRRAPARWRSGSSHDARRRRCSSSLPSAIIDDAGPTMASTSPRAVWSRGRRPRSVPSSATIDDRAPEHAAGGVDRVDRQLGRGDHRFAEVAPCAGRAAACRSEHAVVSAERDRAWSSQRSVVGVAVIATARARSQCRVRRQGDGDQVGRQRVTAITIEERGPLGVGRTATHRYDLCSRLACHRRCSRSRRVHRPRARSDHPTGRDRQRRRSTPARPQLGGWSVWSRPRPESVGRSRVLPGAGGPHRRRGVALFDDACGRTRRGRAASRCSPSAGSGAASSPRTATSTSCSSTTASRRRSSRRPRRSGIRSGTPGSSSATPFARSTTTRLAAHRSRHRHGAAHRASARRRRQLAERGHREGRAIWTKRATLARRPAGPRSASARRTPAMWPTCSSPTSRTATAGCATRTRCGGRRRPASICTPRTTSPSTTATTCC